MADATRGRPPIPQALVDEIERRLAAGQTQTTIARHLGIGRTTVYRIAEGQHCQTTDEHATLNPGETATLDPRGEHCPGCGGRIIVLPCRLCALRNPSSASERCTSRTFASAN